MNYEKQLKDLRNKLAREQMSLLVGAGFSKNVHHSFLSWDELLFDLANEIYADEIKNAYQQIAKASSKPKLTLKAFSKQKCKEITVGIPLKLIRRSAATWKCVLPIFDQGVLGGLTRYSGAN